MSSELKKRIVSAIILAAVVLYATIEGGFAFRIVAALIGVLVYYEWSTITRLSERNFRTNAFGWLVSGLIAFNLLFGDDSLAVPLLAGGVLTGVFFALLRWTNWWLPGGILYAGLSGISLAVIRGDNQAGLVAMVFLFAVVWATDILAYFVGRALKGPKLAPSISPGKTWSVPSAAPYRVWRQR